MRSTRASATLTGPERTTGQVAERVDGEGGYPALQLFLASAIVMPITNRESGHYLLARPETTPARTLSSGPADGRVKDRQNTWISSHREPTLPTMATAPAADTREGAVSQNVINEAPSRST